MWLLFRAAPPFGMRTMLAAPLPRGLPREIATHVVAADDREILDLNAWSMAEFNAGAYPEQRIFRALFAEICGRLPEPSARLVIMEKAGWFFPKRPRVLECGER